MAAVPADILPPEVRRPSVELAQKLSKPTILAPLPLTLVDPFNPPAFGQPDEEELRAIAAAQAATAASTAQSKPSNDRDLLKVLAQRVSPSGTIALGGEPLLIFGPKRLRVGDYLTVTEQGTNYKLEIAAIETATFTLRLNRAEITRRINLGNIQ